MCLENDNQDAVLIVEARDALIINQNDSPLNGEYRFLRGLVRQYKKTFLLSLCSIDADMFNFVDKYGYFDDLLIGNFMKTEVINFTFLS